ncbi:MAG TPA: membrane protein insertase YidC [Candidatus Competibacteraceae bacterium]|nr:membrane protein insertase YidC [Candidatus Competibacteraceae bacterium]
MENQRLFLVIALVFVLFLIWQAWMQEQAARTAPPPTAVSTQAQPGQDGTVPDSAALPAPPAPAGAAPAQAAAPSSAKRVRVVTDVFEAEIDAIGGDLRRVGLRTYPESLERKDQPFVLMKDSGPELFFAQTGLLSSTSPAPNHLAEFTPLASEYRLPEGQDVLQVPLVWRDPSGITVTKTYTFRRGSFLVELSQKVENGSSSEWRGVQYRQLQRTPPVKSSGAFGVYTYTGGVISTQEKNYQKVSFDEMAKKDLALTVTGGWVAMIQHYFVGAWVPASQEESNQFYTKAVDGNRYVLGMLGQQPQTVAPGASAEFKSQLYVGPKIQDTLEKIAPHLELTVDYGWLTILAQPLFWLLKFFHGLVGNWGWAIIFLTVLIKAVFFKLSETSYRSMAKMRKFTPQIQRLRERYGDDRQKLNQAMMELYRKEKVNPLGGCLPILVQIPVFIALYWMLLESVELRQAPWLGWIQDLSQQDPYYILPLIMGASMFIQQKLNPPPPDPVQAKVMAFMPLLFTVFFLWFPAGLVLYWVVNNLLSIAQQWVITRRIEAGEDKPAKA